MRGEPFPTTAPPGDDAMTRCHSNFPVPVGPLSSFLQVPKTCAGLLIVGALLPQGALAQQASIVGGQEVVDRTSPVFLHTARLLVSAQIVDDLSVPKDLRGVKMSWRCSSTLVDKRTLVTAAHCYPEKVFVADPVSKKGVWVGVGPKNTEVFFLESSRVDSIVGARTVGSIRHPGYSDDWVQRTNDAWNPVTPVNDIAVVRLASDAPAFKASVTLGRAGDALRPGTRLTLAGYGKSGVENPLEMPSLRQVSVPFHSFLRNGTDAYLGEGDPRTPRKVTTPRGACGGDSGGPVYQGGQAGVEAKLVGVIVRGPDSRNGGCEASVTIATDVRAYAAWIESAGAFLESSLPQNKGFAVGGE
ncbi:MAG: trypsin-like serine protease [Silvanigrellales bacterium]|nr:trypsin-like serine protease [Silvanigrellales bacterium]